MKFLIALFFNLSFPIFIFLTTILYAPDITPILKTELVKNNIYSQLSSQLDQLNTGDTNSALIGQFIQNNFTSAYLQRKVDDAIDSSDDWITGKTTTPPVLSFKDVKDNLDTQYPQLLPTLEQAAEELKQEEEQNPDIQQQNPQAIKNLDMIESFAKSDFTIPLTKYLVGLKNFYTTVRIVEPILAVLVIVCLVLLGTINKTWPKRFKWIGITLLISSIFGFILAVGGSFLIPLFQKNAATITNTIQRMMLPILLPIISHYINAFASYQKIASTISLCIAAGCFVGFAKTRNKPAVQPNQKQSPKSK